MTLLHLDATAEGWVVLVRPGRFLWYFFVLYSSSVSTHTYLMWLYVSRPMCKFIISCSYFILFMDVALTDYMSSLHSAISCWKVVTLFLSSIFSSHKCWFCVVAIEFLQQLLDNTLILFHIIGNLFTLQFLTYSSVFLHSIWSYVFRMYYCFAIVWLWWL